MQYPELYRREINVAGDNAMHNLPKDVFVRAWWINAILKRRKQVIEESVHTFYDDIPTCLIN